MRIKQIKYLFIQMVAFSISNKKSCLFVFAISFLFHVSFECNVFVLNKLKTNTKFDLFVSPAI